ncbi:hypothetical protein JCM10914_723 [Paenibacillus sp. JCM 10914]|nr:hypothetical protein JCM10914_723 [Paenibacillus sp. JCM 10914]
MCWSQLGRVILTLGQYFIMSIRQYWILLRDDCGSLIGPLMYATIALTSGETRN